MAVPCRSVAAFDFTPVAGEGAGLVDWVGFDVDDAPAFGLPAAFEFGLSWALLVAAARVIAARTANM